MSIAFLEGAEYAAATSEETVMTVDYRERYHSADKIDLLRRRCDTPHTPVPVTSGGIIEDPLTKALERVVELEALVETQGNRIQVLLVANRELTEKVKK